MCTLQPAILIASRPDDHPAAHALIRGSAPHGDIGAILPAAHAVDQSLYRDLRQALFIGNAIYDGEFVLCEIIRITYAPN
jgi:hypothetical protein